jgi:hypothetical protein
MRHGARSIERQAHDVVRGTVGEVGEETDTASVMLALG